MADIAFTFLGFGEAAQAFAAGQKMPFGAYDRKTANAATRDPKRADYARCGAVGFDSNAAAVRAAPLIFSLVTAGQALPAAQDAAASIRPGALYCDGNSVAPDTKRAAANVIEAAGGCYVDVAILSPVHPAMRKAPLLLSGPHAEAGEAALREMGFTNIRIQAGALGTASAIKMIRSVIVKGIEALTAECFLAAGRAGVTEEVRASLNAVWPGIDWAAKADYNLERMMVHGIRRAEELEEVVKTLDALGTGSAMSRGAVDRQGAIGRLGLTAPDGLKAKIAAILGVAVRDAA